MARLALLRSPANEAVLYIRLKIQIRKEKRGALVTVPRGGVEVTLSVLAALPPDERKGSALPARLKNIMGLRLRNEA